MCFFDLQMKLYKNDVYPKHEKENNRHLLQMGIYPKNVIKIWQKPAGF